MRFLVLVFVCLVMAACGKSEKEIKENPTNCSVKEVSEGVEFSCVDKNGVATSGTVKHGKNGAQGEVGPIGQTGKGLALVSAVHCKGVIEGWLENSSYEIDFQQSEFETGDTFLSSVTVLKRGTEEINKRNASAFFISGEKSLHDGLFSMSLSPAGLEVSSQGGIKATLACKEVK